jgi:hypothetical protein
MLGNPISRKQHVLALEGFGGIHIIHQVRRSQDSGEIGSGGDQDNDEFVEIVAGGRTGSLWYSYVLA